jgi:hypothetical protein
MLPHNIAMKSPMIPVRRAALAALLVSLFAIGSSRAGWEDMAGTYVGKWKTSDTDGASYSGKATVKIIAGKGNTLKISMKTSFLGLPITANGKAPASGDLTLTVTNAILGTVTGAAKATAGGANGKINGTAPLYGGTATLSVKFHATKDALTGKGTLVRALPNQPVRELTGSFSGKKK